MRYPRVLGRGLVSLVAIVAVAAGAMPAGAVVQAWTTIIDGARGAAADTVEHDGATYALLDGNDPLWPYPPDRILTCTVARIDADGRLAWVRDVGASPSLDCVGMTGDDTGLYVAMNSTTGLDGEPGVGGFDAYVRKIDFGAAEQWTRAFASPDPERIWSIAAGDGGVVIGGEAYLEDAFVRRYEADGALRWTRYVRTDVNEIAMQVAVDGTGVYAALWVPWGYDTQLRRLTPDGALDWRSPLGGSEVTGMQALGGVLYVGGATLESLSRQGSSGGWDAFVASIDVATGTRRWVRQFGSTEGDYALDLALGPQGVYLGGYTYGALPRFHNHGFMDGFVRSYAFDGHRRWTRQIGTHTYDWVHAVGADDAGVIATGYTYGNLGTVGHVEDAAFVRRWTPA